MLNEALPLKAEECVQVIGGRPLVVQDITLDPASRLISGRMSLINKEHLILIDVINGTNPLCVSLLDSEAELHVNPASV